MHAKVAEFLARAGIPDYSNNPNGPWVQELYTRLVGALFPLIESNVRTDASQLVSLFVYLQHGFGQIGLAVDLSHLAAPTAAQLAVNLNKNGAYFDAREQVLADPGVRECRHVDEQNRGQQQQRSEGAAKVQQLQRGLEAAGRRAAYASERRQANAVMGENEELLVECSAQGKEHDEMVKKCGETQAEAEQLAHKSEERGRAVEMLAQLVKTDSNTQVHVRSKIDELKLMLQQAQTEEQRVRSNLERQTANSSALEQAAQYGPVVEGSVAQHAQSLQKLDEAEREGGELRQGLETNQRELMRAKDARTNHEMQRDLQRDQHAKVAETCAVMAAEQTARDAKLNEDLRALSAQIAQDRSSSVELQYQLRSRVENNEQMTAMLATNPRLLADAEGRLDAVIRGMAIA